MAQSADVRARRRARRRADHPGHGRVRRRADRARAARRRGPHGRRRQRGARRRRRARRHRRHPPRARRRQARRRAHPHLAPALRPRPSCPSTSSSSGPASPARSSCRPTSRWAPGSRWCPAATACCPARTPTPPRCCRTCSPSAAWRSSRRPGPSRCAATATAWSSRSPTAARSTGSHALMTVGSVPNTAELGLEKVGIDDRTGRVHPGRPGVPHLACPGVYAAGDCTGAAHARLRRRDAGPDRDVARAGRGRDADQAQDGGRRRVHPPGDRDGRHQPARDRRRRGAGAHDHAAALDQPAGQDAGPAPRVREAVLPPGHRAWSSAGWWWRRWPAS